MSKEGKTRGNLHPTMDGDTETHIGAPEGPNEEQKEEENEKRK